MRRIIIAPDSFKGTMSAQEICAILGDVVREYVPEAEIIGIPMADGGEGMVDACLGMLGGEKLFRRVQGPDGRQVDCPYGVLPDGTAVMEMAGCAGLPLMEGRLDPLHASTYGVGQMLDFLSGQGHRRLLLGIGGSATNDCGVGMAAALGWRFLDESGEEVEPFACNIGKIRRICPPGKALDMSITVACDVDNPLCGERGASAIFGPQKGLKPEQIAPLDNDIRAFAALIKEHLGCDVVDIPGAGAAGGLGAALMAFLSGELKPGIELLLDAAGLDEKLPGAELVITGEGRIDYQTAAGKVPVGVSRRAKKAGVPCIAICGCIGRGAEAVLAEGISAYYATSDGKRSMDELRLSCRDDLTDTARKVLKEYLL